MFPDRYSPWSPFAAALREHDAQVIGYLLETNSETRHRMVAPPGSPTSSF